MKIINDISNMSDEQGVLLTAISIGTNLDGKSRYYLMQQTYKGEDKKLLKFFGFSSKEDFKTWRDTLNIHHPNKLVEWAAGFLFKFYGDDHHYTLVDKNGKEPKHYW